MIVSKRKFGKSIGHRISQCIGILKGQYIRAEKYLEIKRLRSFEDLWNNNGTDDVSRAALETINRKHLEKPQAFPVAKDVQKFVKFLKSKAKKGLQILEDDEKNISGYRMLMEATLLLLILFNRRRSGEVERLLLQTYQHPIETNTHDDILECLSKTEKKLFKELTLIKTPGKGRKMVPILLTKNIKKSLDLLSEKRKIFEEFATNQFLFAAATALGHCEASSTFRKYADKAEL